MTEYVLYWQHIGRSPEPRLSGYVNESGAICTDPVLAERHSSVGSAVRRAHRYGRTYHLKAHGEMGICELTTTVRRMP